MIFLPGDSMTRSQAGVAQAMLAKMHVAAAWRTVCWAGPGVVCDPNAACQKYVKRNTSSYQVNKDGMLALHYK